MIANTATASNEPTRGAARMTRVPLTAIAMGPLARTTSLLIHEHPEPWIVPQGPSRTGATHVMRPTPPPSDDERIEQEVQCDRAHEPVHEDVEPRRGHLARCHHG